MYNDLPLERPMKTSGRTSLIYIPRYYHVIRLSEKNLKSNTVSIPKHSTLDIFLELDLELDMLTRKDFCINYYKFSLVLLFWALPLKRIIFILRGVLIWQIRVPVWVCLLPR